MCFHDLILTIFISPLTFHHCFPLFFRRRTSLPSPPSLRRTLTCLSTMPSALLTVPTDPPKVGCFSYHQNYCLHHSCQHMPIDRWCAMTVLHMISFLTSFLPQFCSLANLLRCGHLPQTLCGWFPLAKGIGLPPRRRRCAQTPLRRHRRWFQGR